RAGDARPRPRSPGPATAGGPQRRLPPGDGGDRFAALRRPDVRGSGLDRDRRLAQRPRSGADLASTAARRRLRRRGPAKAEPTRTTRRPPSRPTGRRGPPPSAHPGETPALCRRVLRRPVRPSPPRAAFPQKPGAGAGPLRRPQRPGRSARPHPRRGPTDLARDRLRRRTPDRPPRTERRRPARRFRPRLRPPVPRPTLLARLRDHDKVGRMAMNVLVQFTRTSCEQEQTVSIVRL